MMNDNGASRFRLAARLWMIFRLAAIALAFSGGYSQFHVITPILDDQEIFDRKVG